MNITEKLELLETAGAFPARGPVMKRWGQLIRETPSIAKRFSSLQESGRLVPLSVLGRIHSGVVTRANAYFIVRELPFGQIPKRFGITKRDLEKTAVVMDGLETPHRIERKFLRTIIKKPDSLISASEIEESDLRLFDVTCDAKTLRQDHAAGAAAYIRRGETVAYSVSDDTLKGGIPAERSQIKNRKPFWYSLNVPEVASERIAVPEHFDKRFIATLIPKADSSVIIDTLYSFTAYDAKHTPLVWSALNSLLTWYQIELRGRTQHGEGVLKVKIPDYGGILIPNPNVVAKAEIDAIVSGFRPVSSLAYSNSLEIAATEERIDFDDIYLKSVGWPKPRESRLEIERALRAAIGEREERKASVVDAKVDRKRTVDVGANVDAYAARLASSLDSYPDPRRFVAAADNGVAVVIAGPVENKLSVGIELFNQGEVLSGQICIARAPNILAAQYVRAVLMNDPMLNVIKVPTEPELGIVMAHWRAAGVEWLTAFEKAAEQITRSINDPRLKAAIIRRAKALLHAD